MEITDKVSEKYLNTAIPAEIGIDKLLIGFLIVWFIFFLIHSFNSRINERFFMILTSLIIITSITTGIFSSSWDINSIEVHNIEYTAFTGKTINGIVGIRIGLGGFNVTLTGIPEEYKFEIGKERVLYNEYFSWSNDNWSHETLEQSFENRLKHGIPLPIISVAENMILDAEYIRWGRYYRLAGYYTYILLWISFSFTFVSTFFILFNSMSHSGLYSIISGLSQLTSTFIWLIVKPYDFIVFLDEAILVPKIGYPMWLVSGTGILSILSGGYLMNKHKLETLIYSKNRIEKLIRDSVLI